MERSAFSLAEWGKVADAVGILGWLSWNSLERGLGGGGAVFWGGEYRLGMNSKASGGKPVEKGWGCGWGLNGKSTVQLGGMGKASHSAGVKRRFWRGKGGRWEMDGGRRWVCVW